jgi:hypothetical protein
LEGNFFALFSTFGIYVFFEVPKWKGLAQGTPARVVGLYNCTSTSGRCDDQEGGVYILDHQTCTDGASAIGWNASDFFLKWFHQKCPPFFDTYSFFSLLSHIKKTVNPI